MLNLAKDNLNLIFSFLGYLSLGRLRTTCKFFYENINEYIITRKNNNYIKLYNFKELYIIGHKIKYENNFYEFILGNMYIFELNYKVGLLNNYKCYVGFSKRQNIFGISSNITNDLGTLEQISVQKTIDALNECNAHTSSNKFYIDQGNMKFKDDYSIYDFLNKNMKIIIE